MNRSNRFLALFGMLIVHLSVFAGFPNWSVNPASYQYQMTVVGKTRFNCNYLEQSNVLVGAFVNNVCRGVDSTRVLVSGQYYVYLTVYSNVLSGEKVEFRVYMPGKDSIYTCFHSLPFENNAAIGTSSLAFPLTDNVPPHLFSAPNKKIFNTWPVLYKITDLIALDSNQNAISYSMLPDPNNNNDYFMIVDNTLRLNRNIIAESNKILKVLCRADDNHGCVLDSLFTFEIINNDPKPTGLAVTSTNLDEHKEIGTVVGKLTALDASPSDQFIYTLVNGAGSEGNRMFQIVNDEILVNADIEFDSAEVYSLRINIRDMALNNLEVNYIVKINELINNKQPLKVNSLVTPNGDNINDVFEIYNVKIYNKFRLEIYDDYGRQTNVFNPNYSATEGYQNTWNGVSDKGDVLPTGMYYYYFLDFNDSQPFKGTIYLIQNK